MRLRQGLAFIWLSKRGQAAGQLANISLLLMSVAVQKPEFINFLRFQAECKQTIAFPSL